MGRLSLMGAYPESERHNRRCANNKMKHLDLAEAKIKMTVKNYRPPSSCSYLFAVEASDKMFEGARNAADGQLRYVEVMSNLTKRFFIL